MIVALHAAEHSCRRRNSNGGAGLGGKSPDSPRSRGYIVIVPEYAGSRENGLYNYSVAAHDAVLRAIVDARKRFHVDSDRVFLTGHGMGGDAAFDIGMSHPDLFAGVVPINGLCDGACKWYSQNAIHTQWYVVTGEFDGRDTFNANAPTLARIMGQSADVVLVEFAQRGYESYHEEGPRIFDWMEGLRRQKPPREFRMSVLRPSESRFYWLRADGLPRVGSCSRPSWPAQPTVPGRVKPMVLVASRSILPGTIRFTSYPPVGRATASGSRPTLSITSRGRVSIHIRGTQKFHGIVKPSSEAILEDYRTVAPTANRSGNGPHRSQLTEFPSLQWPSWQGTDAAQVDSTESVELSRAGRLANDASNSQQGSRPTWKAATKVRAQLTSESSSRPNSRSEAPPLKLIGEGSEAAASAGTCIVAGAAVNGHRLIGRKLSAR